MKRVKQLVLLAAILLACLTSCSTDDAGGSEAAPSGTLTAKVNNVDYQSMEISSSATIANTGGAKSLVIIATNSDGNAFAMTVFGYEGAGTYEFTGANLAITNVASYTETKVNLSNPTASTTEVWQAPYNDSKVGTVTVSEETDTKVIGTFSFKCKNVNGDNSVKDITSGAFNLNKQTT